MRDCASEPQNEKDKEWPEQRDWTLRQTCQHLYKEKQERKPLPSDVALIMRHLRLELLHLLLQLGKSLLSRLLPRLGCCV